MPTVRLALVAVVAVADVCAPPEQRTETPTAAAADEPTEDNAAPVYAVDDPEGEADASAASADEPATEHDEPAPEPVREPPTAEEIDTALAALAGSLREAGLNRTPSDRLHGWMPKQATELRAAWADGRAIAWKGTPKQVAQWAEIALFGSAKPTTSTVSGLAAPFEVDVVKVDDDNAFLHVYVPADGLAPRGGTHRSWVKDEVWVCIADRLRPGVDFIPFKSSETPSAHRQWAREWVVDKLVAVAAEYRERTGTLLGIGDASLVLGGKMSDHWTHRRGVDVDVYLLDTTGDGAEPRIWWHTWTRGESRWTARAEGKGAREDAVAEAADGTPETASDRRLRALAEILVADDDLWFFVHDSPRVLSSFDEAAQASRPGRRFLHAENRAFWPAHQDHVHLRWATAKVLPVGVPPKP